MKVLDDYGCEWRRRGQWERYGAIILWDGDVEGFQRQLETIERDGAVGLYRFYREFHRPRYAARTLR